MKLTRRDLIKKGSFFCLASMLGHNKILQAAVEGEKEFEIIPAAYAPYAAYFSDTKPVVSIVKVNSKWSDARGIEYAVTKALDLIGGPGQVAKGKERVILKPNLVSPNPADTTKPLVIEALARLMKKAGKNVCIAEASGGARQNTRADIRGYSCRTRNYETLQAIQNEVYGRLGYVDLSEKIHVPLVNLHVGKMAKLVIPDNFAFKEIYIHEELYRADLVCSVPMMKTHGLAGVTLALKNIGIGAFPGVVYGAVKSAVHRQATKVEPTGTSTAIVDMVKANKVGLSVIDATTAMEGQGPSVRGGGQLVKMNLIIASTNPLAADIVAAAVMGFDSGEIDTFSWAWKAGMKPAKLADIRIAGEKLSGVRKEFTKPTVTPYTMLKDWYGPDC